MMQFTSRDYEYILYFLTTLVGVKDEGGHSTSRYIHGNQKQFQMG